MLVSVIIPLYKGRKYIPRLIRIIEYNKQNLYGINDVELIFVNDYPDEIISEEDIRSNDIKTKLVVNPQNYGIHKSRIIGLENALGEYILFLDQDDVIKRDCIDKQIEAIKDDSDVVVCNGIVKAPTYRKMLYKYWFMHITVKYLFFYTKFGCRIISPGQCLIRKSSIPELWKKEVLINNGADDFFLWILLLSKGKKFSINRRELYQHIIHANNTSNDEKTIIDSTLEVVDLLEKNSVVTEKQLYQIRKFTFQEKSLLVRMIERINMKKK